ncbi:MAG: hypothetical protein WAU07_01185 [Microgenomates group bacterium]
MAKEQSSDGRDNSRVFLRKKLDQVVGWGTTKLTEKFVNLAVTNKDKIIPFLQKTGISDQIIKAIFARIASGEISISNILSYVKLGELGEGSYFQALKHLAEVESLEQIEDGATPSRALEQLLGLLKIEDVGLTTLLNKPNTKIMIEHLRAMGGGALQEFLAGLSDSTYRNWYEQNAPEVVLTGRLAERYQLTEEEEKPDVWICSYCNAEHTTIPQRCASCDSQGNFKSYRRTETQAYLEQQEVIKRWHRETTQKRKELAALSAGNSTDQAQLLGATAAVTLAGGGLTTFFNQLGLTTRDPDEAVKIVRKSFEKKKGHTEFRLPGKDSQKLKEELTNLMVGNVTIENGATTDENPIVADTVIIKAGATINCPILCRVIDFQGDGIVCNRGAIIFGALRGNAPKLAGRRYMLVIDDKVGINAINEIDAEVTTISVDKAFDLAQHIKVI